MKWFSLLTLCAVAFFANACERHPLPGQTPVQEHGKGREEHTTPSVEKHSGTPETSEGHPKPAQQDGGAPKFFPEKK